jgi:hypothetical protein
MKSKVRCLFIAILALLILPGCKKNEFTVSFTMQKDVNSTCRMLYYASDSHKGWYIETAADIREGKGELKGITHNPTLVFLFKGSQPVSFFYAERGEKIIITGKGNDPAAWDIKGNKINERLTEWRSANTTKLSDTKSCNKAVASYVKGHTDDPVSALLLMLYYDRREDEKGFQKLFKSLTGDAAKPKWRDLVSRADIITDAEMPGKMPKTLILSTPNGRDTVKTIGKPMLIVFTKTTDNDHEGIIKSLLALSREWKDSASRIIIDYNIDTDSISRYRSVRFDSISGVIRAWAPLGFSDPYITSIGVSGFPSARVSDAKGKVLYFGDDVEEAVTKFKTQKKNN